MKKKRKIVIDSFNHLTNPLDKTCLCTKCECDRNLSTEFSAFKKFFDKDKAQKTLLQLDIVFHTSPQDSKEDIDG